MRRLTVVLCGSLFLLLAGCQSNSVEGKTNAFPDLSKPASGLVSGSQRPAVELPAGTVLEARLDQSLSTQRNRAGDKFEATLEAPVNVDGREILARGTKLTGHVTTSHPSGRFKGRAVLGVRLDSVSYQGREIPLETSASSRASAAHKKRNITLIGGGTGLGALLGAVAGGGQGAAIGAAAGAGAGTVGAAVTGKRNVAIPAETLFRFKLKAPVSL